MNSIVSLPIAAAVPVASPMADKPSSKEAELARFEQAVNVLRTRHVCEGWTMDEAAAERALSYFRKGCPDDDDEWSATLYFIASHGLSFEWIHFGDPSVMIAHGASVSRQAASHGTDPIYAAIEAHKAAAAHVKTVLDTHTILEKELPSERRRSNVNVWEEVIVETDDPSWIECEHAVMGAWDAEEDAARDLVCIQPTTRAGFLALIEHAIVYDTDGYAWPSSLQSDDGERTRNWHQFLLENLVASKAALIAGI